MTVDHYAEEEQLDDSGFCCTYSEACHIGVSQAVWVLSLVNREGFASLPAVISNNKATETCPNALGEILYLLRTLGVVTLDADTGTIFKGPQFDNNWEHITPFIQMVDGSDV